VAQPQSPEQEIAALENYQKGLEAEKTELEQEMGGVKARIEELKTTSQTRKNNK
jgi:chromosome segregation ATPase